MRIFLSFHFEDDRPEYELFVNRVSYYLKKQEGLEPYCYAGAKSDRDWMEEVGHHVTGDDSLVLFVGRAFGIVQRQEARVFRDACKGELMGKAVAVYLPGHCEIDDDLFQYRATRPIEVEKVSVEADTARGRQTFVSEKDAEMCAKSINAQLGAGRKWIEPDGLPIGYPFDYEKVIIEEYVDGGGCLLKPRRLAQGCPQRWPDVAEVGVGKKQRLWRNPLDERDYGSFRKREDRIIVDARTRYHCPGSGMTGPCLARSHLTFPEAGPRESLRYPIRNDLNVAILVSGGIAPGINAVISGIVQRHELYKRGQAKRARNEPEAFTPYALRITMYRDGLAGLLNNRKIELNLDKVREASNAGGSMISTARYDELLDDRDPVERDAALNEAVQRLLGADVDILYVIGGDGSMRAAHAIWTRAKTLRSKRHRPLSVVAIPKTMDNDVSWVWQSFGFLSAVEVAKRFILQLHTEAKSNPRLCIVQLFGSDSGFVVSHAALASGACMAALIPEVSFTMKSLSAYIRAQLEDQYRNKMPEQSPFGIVLLAETAIPLDVEDYIDSPDYPSLKLDELEKQEIRRFVGSALITIKEVLSWDALRKQLTVSRSGEERSALTALRERLPAEILALLRAGAEQLAKDTDLQSLVLRALNQVISGPVLSLDEGYAATKKPRSQAHRIATILENLTGLLKTVADAEAPLGEELNMQLLALMRSLNTVRLSSEAREKVKAIEDRLANGGAREEWSDEEPAAKAIWELRSDLEIVRKRLGERLNREIVESALPAVIAKSRAPLVERRILGQTPDEVRTGGLKIVSHVLQWDIQHNPDDRDGYWTSFRVFKNEPRHLIRAISPSVTDVIFGQRLGMLAVDNAMAGFTDFMVSQWLTEYVLVPLELVALGRKRVPQGGIFWKSVLANTGQPADMVSVPQRGVRHQAPGT